MNHVVTPEIREVMEAVHFRPAVSLIMPFEPKMSLKTELAQALNFAVDKIIKELEINYPGDIVALMKKKLTSVIKEINFNTHKKSIAVYVSPVFEKVLYLDMPVEEKILIDESFEIRDLVYCKKQLHKYLALVLSSKESKMYLGNSNEFIRIVSNTPESVNAYINDLPEKVANFSDASERKEIMLDKFLRHIDNSLDIIFEAYHLPVFVLGTDRVVGHFKKITRHSNVIIDFIHGNYEEATSEELRKIVQPKISDWKKIKQTGLIKQLEEAEGNKKLAIGIKDVWHEAVNKKGRLLVVEKNYMYPAEHGDSEEVIFKAIEPYNKYSYIKDAVDDVIEKVLENGGDIEFVEKDMLKKYNHIALIQYY